MAKPKKTTSKKTTIKPKATETKKVEVVKEEPKKEVTSYIVPIALSREPIEKNIPVADLYYHVTSNTFDLHTSLPSSEAEVEMVIEGDISIESNGSISMVSKAESPIKWIQSLKDSREFAGNPFIAGEAQEIYEA
jgi:hypothetical protein|tara:strand:+ start:33 stop:437 length:405 start_codon:yes stop_codon:yes gene_type:complete